ncbi:hypothetical protein [Kitasatospora sp. NPDC058218]|uniref:hypothetical protein n=1 Tax=Kitasatospora sp. NPDC058218 TaxID=3346385 RepID=UPI0036DE8FF3
MAIRWGRWVMWGALGGAAALVGAAVVGRSNRRSGGLLVAQQRLDEPLLFGTSALALLIVALVFSPWPSWVRGGLGCAVVVLGVGTVPFWILSSDGPRTTHTEAAPGRPDRVLVVRQDQAGFGPDPLYWVYVDQGSGLATRRWRVTYVDGDHDDLREAAWDGPDRLRVVTSKGGTRLIAILADGRPESTVGDRS